MDWRVKGVVQKLLGFVPGGVRLNDLLQQTIGGLKDFREACHAKVEQDWLVLASHMRELGISPQGLQFLEIGTGWFPILPACYALSGAASCATFDLVRHMNGPLTMRMLPILSEFAEDVSRATGRALADVEQDCKRFQEARSVEDFLQRARIEYHAPADATRTALPDCSVDVVFSNSVMEHVEKSVIAAMMHESRRILRPGGLAIHSVNCGDHYAYFDKRITAINYLTYSHRDWKFWDTKLLYQNRLRPDDFLALARDAGLNIILEKQTPRKDLLEALPRLKISPEFQLYSAAQLCTTSIDFVAQKNR